MKDTKKFVEYYRDKKVTGTYDLQREGTKYRRQKRKLELKIFLDLLDKKPREKVLELGCSSGFLTAHLGKVTAIDTSEGMLKVAHRRNPKAKCIYADMFELPFKKNSFDKVVTMRVWTHLDKTDLRRALKETKRVLKKGGILVFDLEKKGMLRAMANFFYKRIFRTTGYKIYRYSLNGIREILSEQGFKIERIIWLKHRIGRQFILRAKKVN